MSPQTQSRFFLTRQNATILEDLHRRLKQAGSISLLHGAIGTGKSRLLRQFNNRLTSEESVFVQFDSNDSFVVNDGKEFSEGQFFNQVIADLKDHSILVIDQFDNASAELQQKFVKFWSAAALDKNLELVISIQSNSLQHLKELSNLYHLQIESVELKPLSRQEQLEYLRSSCCTDTRQVAEISSKLKKNLKLTNGVFSQLEAFRSQYDAEINCVDMPVSRQMKLKNLLLAGFSGLLILTLMVFTFQNSGLNTESLQVPASLPGINSGISQSPKTNTVKLATEPKSDIPLVVEKKSDNVDRIIPVDEIEQNLEIKQGSTDKLQLISIKNAPIKSEQINLNESMLETVEHVSTDVVTGEQPKLSVFQQRLQATELWLSSVNINSASIQLMTLSVGKDPQQTLNKYLIKLKSEPVDLDKIKIYPFSKGDKKMYGVLYGEFNNLKLAYSEIKRLPDVLKANKPFARTVKGIKDDVNRF